MYCYQCHAGCTAAMPRRRATVIGTMDKGSEEYNQCAEVLAAMKEREEAEPFLVPVDWKGLGIPDYPKIVKKPMDLGTVEERLEAGKYARPDKFAEEVRLIWQNAQRFNQPGSGIYASSESLSRFFEKRFAKVAQKGAAGNKR